MILGIITYEINSMYAELIQFWAEFRNAFSDKDNKSSIILLQVRCFKVVGSLYLNRTQGCRKTQPEYFIPHKRSNSTQDFTSSL